MKHTKTLLIVVVSVFTLFASQTTFAQSEKLGAVKYTPPKGWTKTAKENVVIFNVINQASGNFCFITLYGATTSSGTPENDFAREWRSRVVDPWGGEVNPKTATEKVDGWTAIGGGSQIDFQGNKAFAFLNVLSGFGKTISVLGILNDDSYLPQLKAFVEHLDMEKENRVVAAAPSAMVDGKLVIPPISRQLTIADLVGEWGQNDGINTRYVDRYSGTYAGFESLHFTNKMTITAGGRYYNDFFAIQNGRKIKEDTAGTVTVNGRVLIISDRNTRKYVIRGWLELPDITILEICGPWYNNDVIPAEIFTNPNQGANLDSKWVRKK